MEGWELFSFVVCFFSLSRKSENGQTRWMKRRRRERTDKGGSSTPGSFDSRGRVSSLFSSCSFLCRRRLRISSFFFIEEEEVNDDALGRGDIFFPESGVWLAQKREFFLFFSIFFSRSTQRDLYTKKESLTSFLLKTKNTYAIRNTRFSRQAKYSFGSVSRRPDMNVGEAMAASGNVSFRFTLRF